MIAERRVHQSRDGGPEALERQIEEIGPVERP
jgi:hypothetical protein